eukprot:7537054-Alexandrium_andersonii.AAC.1
MCGDRSHGPLLTKGLHLAAKVRILIAIPWCFHGRPHRNACHMCNAETGRLSTLNDEGSATDPWITRESSEGPME